MAEVSTDQSWPKDSKNTHIIRIWGVFGPFKASANCYGDALSTRWSHTPAVGKLLWDEPTYSPGGLHPPLLGLHFAQISAAYIFPSLNSTYFSANFIKKFPLMALRKSVPLQQCRICQVPMTQSWIICFCQKGDFLSNRLTSCGRNSVNCTRMCL